MSKLHLFQDRRKLAVSCKQSFLLATGKKDVGHRCAMSLASQYVWIVGLAFLASPTAEN
ncbi:MAG TPA: hypothetical protein VHN74_09670 [Candidatus Angelobacter sp.]|nr:hypothetical protein [Candidatus Angelobacter sp.]